MKGIDMLSSAENSWNPTPFGRGEAYELDWLRQLTQHKHASKLPATESGHGRTFEGPLHQLHQAIWKGSLGRLGLGEMSYLLDSIANGESDSVLGAHLRSCGIQAPLLRSVSDDLLKISKKYRNGAAHTHRLTRENLLEFRTLLFNSENGLLKRLVDLGRRVEAENPKG